MYEPALLSKSEVEINYSKAFLSLGELIIADTPTNVWTVLGSCVSVVLYNPRLKVSALCHAQLAETDVFGKKTRGVLDEKYFDIAVKDDFRYVGCSIKYMLEQFLARGINKNEICASIYGGANVIALFTHKIGTINSIAAVEVLEKYGIRIIKKDIGGEKSRTIRHYSDTGVTHVRVL